MAAGVGGFDFFNSLLDQTLQEVFANSLSKGLRKTRVADQFLLEAMLLALSDEAEDSLDRWCDRMITLLKKRRDSTVEFLEMLLREDGIR